MYEQFRVYAASLHIAHLREQDEDWGTATAVLQDIRTYTAEEYLALEVEFVAHSEIRNGVVVEMTSVTLEHKSAHWCLQFAASVQPTRQNL